MKWVLTILGLLYVLNPFDLLPDVLPGAGWVDDLAVLGLLGYFLYRTGYRGFPFGGKASPDQDRTGEASKASGREGAQDPHHILGIGPGADQKQIRQAYRRLAAQYHPDKVAHLGEDLRELAEKKFKAIQAAYDALRRP
jgi:hypothetical protein